MARIVASAVLALMTSIIPALADPPLPTSKPEDVGLSSERLRRIGSVIKADVDKGRLPGMVVAVARRGKLAYFESFGFRDKTNNVALEKDAIFSIASMTKPLTSTAIMMLFEDGRLLLGDPVGKYLPPLAESKVGIIKTDAAGKISIETVAPNRPVTIQDLLRHTSGYVYGGRGDSPIHKLYPGGSAVAARALSGPEFLEKMSTLPLYNQPGEIWEYSFSTDILGLVVEAVSGKSLGAFLQERIFAPLGMQDTAFAVPDDKRSRYALPLAADPDTGRPVSVLHADPKPLKFECGGGCAASTVSDYLRFAQMLANKGTLDGKRLLSRRSVELMTSNHLAPAVLARTTSTVLSPGHGFGLGFAIRLEDGLSELAGSQGDYTWGGAYGTYFWVDPKEELAVVYMAHTPGPARLHYRALMRSLVMQAIAD